MNVRLRTTQRTQAQLPPRCPADLPPTGLERVEASWVEEFLDCTGLGVLVAVRNAAVRAGGQMRVSHPRPIVRRVLEVTGLLGVFTAPTIVPAAGSGYPSRVGPTPAGVTQPPDLMVAA
jgi:STAS domain